jgi:hypothetical protein
VEVCVDRIVEKIVTIEVEQVHEVEVEVIVERPLTVEVFREKEVYIEKVIERPTEVITCKIFSSTLKLIF